MSSLSGISGFSEWVFSMDQPFIGDPVISKIHIPPVILVYRLSLAKAAEVIKQKIGWIIYFYYV